jgi:protein-S-isoprenylcysteine O-methyltransferase Ste14
VHVFAQFVRAGWTPMPGATPRRLVVSGFSRYVPNPIYLGSVTIFVGEAVLLGQLSVLVCAIATWGGGAAIFVRWYEEPALARRFGLVTRHTNAVSAWRPRLHPRSPDDLG